LSLVFHSAMIFITALSLPFMMRTPIDLPLIMSIELIEIFKSIMPYLFIVIFTMILMYNYPELALYLPDFFFGIGK